MKYIRVVCEVHRDLPFGIAAEFSAGRRVFEWQYKCVAPCLFSHTSCLGVIHRNPTAKWVCIRQLDHFLNITGTKRATEAEYAADQL